MNMISVHPLDPPMKTNATYQSTSSVPTVKETAASKHLRGYNLPMQFFTRYTIGEELGSGGFGFVISVKERSTGQERAVKFIFKNKVPSSAWVNHNGQTLPMEIYVLKYIQHDNIVGYVDSFEDDVYFYLVMELHGSQWNQPPSTTTPTHIPGLSHTSEPSDDDDEEEEVGQADVVSQGYQLSSSSSSSSTSNPSMTIPFIGRRGSCDLFECIEQHRTFDESLAKYIFRQIVDCVAHLDKLGICHRDLKDENIVIDSDYKVKLIDFGSAVALPRHYQNEQQKSKRRTVVLHRKFYGTIAFASPEILRMEPYQAEPAEVWSLGVLLYTLVFGEVPFSNPRMALAAQFHPPTKIKVSSKCLHLISCLLEKSPHGRPTIHQVLTHPWLRQQ
ncbi:kinase-like domain-containing protein [Halteromyces radiatus]|uniref:kinase-like domain-containing protein n=1 Tax=Halteromyces radiatus TaxID=101107 RepID=UPI00221ED194|nr:kinase-like domain-containing protein [Halteromyces radiatus]KAI8084951.1 kinase-like domain-containing protein [Halteromyces radiatus]